MDGAPGPPPVGPARDGPPWERERSIASLLETLKGVLLEPTRTYREASQDANIGYALLYWLIFGFITGSSSGSSGCSPMRSGKHCSEGHGSR